MCRASCDPIDRIAELERQHATAMAIVRAVADVQPASHEDDTYYCIFCEQEEARQADDRWGIPHTADCLVTQAHALVAGETREEAGE